MKWLSERVGSDLERLLDWIISSSRSLSFNLESFHDGSDCYRQRFRNKTVWGWTTLKTAFDIHSVFWVWVADLGNSFDYFFWRCCSPFLVIIDRRDSTWHSVRRALSLLNDTTSETGLALKTVLVIRPRFGYKLILSLWLVNQSQSIWNLFKVDFKQFYLKQLLDLQTMDMILESKW